jgi:hypothetical protein
MDLTSQQQRAILGLLATPSVEAAAKQAGCTSRAVYKWLREPEFKRALGEARREALAQAVGRLAALTGAATEALERNLTCGRPAAEIRAATSILDIALRGLELDDLAQRIEALEARIQPSRSVNGKVKTWA